MMFVLVISVIIYAFYFAVSFTALHYRSYEVFMIGRAILSSSKSYNDKALRANYVKAAYDEAAVITAVKAPSCEMDATQGFRGTMDYGFPPKFYVSSNAGVACSVYANYLLPAVITRNSGNQLQVAIESMTGSEMSEDHAKCAMDPGKMWGDCLQGGGINVVADNWL
jgi:hypothetical protein